MRHATPCIHLATFASAMQLHASALQLFRNWKGSKKINQSDASIIKVFNFCWAQLYMSSGTTVLLNSCTHALCTCCQLWFALQYLTLSLWFACINPTDHATTAPWAPCSQVQFMRSTPSPWILPRNIHLGLLMHAPCNSMHVPCTLCMQHLQNRKASK